MSVNRSLVTLVFCLIFIAPSRTQDELYQTTACARREDCGSCLTAGEFCYWCDDSSFNRGNLPSCNTREILLKSGCPSSNIMGNQPTSHFILEDQPLTDFHSREPANVNQMRPQKVYLSMRPGQTHTINFEYRLAKNYPLDLYFLMDLTWSMRDDKDTLVGLQYDLPVALGRLTDNFKLGFGSFADKPLMPYTAMDPIHLENPCSGEQSVCEPTYTFRHRLGLTEEVLKFVSIINATSVTGNLDNMEATFEALMQVLVCDEKIGWSKISRKIVILATVGKIHFAGMGKLGGVVKRNDEQCHVDEEGSYTESILMDYPSLSQIDRILRDKKINVIFAVTENVKQDYDKINELLPDTTYVGKLEADSSNVLSLVRKGYQDFSSAIGFEDDAGDMFEVKYYSDCGSGQVIETSKCEPVMIGETYRFTVNITLKDCTAEQHGPSRIVIYESQISTDVLTIDLSLQCKCECENSNENVVCPAHSTLECGKCICNEDWLGPNCDCNINDVYNTGDDLRLSCVAPADSMERTVCSGAGDCYCGTCFCDYGYYGSFCECKDCYRDPKTGTECGGPNRGICSCGQCICRDGYEGPSCSCATGTAPCTLPGDETPCSGRGVCKCGECICDKEGTNKYAGKFCDVCTNCGNPACQLYEDCARAAALNNPTSGACSSPTGLLFIPTIFDVPLPDKPANISKCYFDVEDNGKTCKYPFTYHVARDWTVDIKIYQRSCWGLVDTAILTLPVFAGTLVLGLLIIAAWKCYIHYSDKRAYAKFAAERDLQLQNMQSQEENPLYKSPVSTYILPQEYRQKE